MLPITSILHIFPHIGIHDKVYIYTTFRSERMQFLTLCNVKNVERMSLQVFVRSWSWFHSSYLDFKMSKTAFWYLETCFTQFGHFSSSTKHSTLGNKMNGDCSKGECGGRLAGSFTEKLSLVYSWPQTTTTWKWYRLFVEILYLLCGWIVNDSIKLVFRWFYDLNNYIRKRFKSMDGLDRSSFYLTHWWIISEMWAPKYLDRTKPQI